MFSFFMLPLRRFFLSFKHAFHGLLYAWRGLSFRLIVFGVLLVTVMMIVFPVTRKEMIVLVLVSSFVLVLEIVNTVFEHLVDMLHPRLHEYVRMIKDLMAGAVLLAALSAFIVYWLIFSPFFF